MEPLLEPLIRSPKLPTYIRQLENALAEEQRKRLHFYETVQEGDKVEFINGEVVMHSPVRLVHDTISGGLYRLLATFVETLDLGYVGHEKMMISLHRNDYEPDVCFWSKAKAASFQAQQLRFPAPDFVAEVLSESTEKIDRGVKREDYASNGITEYWIIDAEHESVEQYLLEADSYALAVKTGDGTLKSQAIPGFVIPARALFDSAERQRTLRVLLG